MERLSHICHRENAVFSKDEMGLFEIESLTCCKPNSPPIPNSAPVPPHSSRSRQSLIFFPSLPYFLLCRFPPLCRISSVKAAGNLWNQHAVVGDQGRVNLWRQLFCFYGFLTSCSWISVNEIYFSFHDLCKNISFYVWNQITVFPTPDTPVFWNSILLLNIVTECLISK